MPERPTEIVLAARVARRYYLQDQSKTQIADELGISRFRVARLLSAARRDGMVSIEVQAPDLLDPALSDDLQRAYGLRHAIVVNVSHQDPVALQSAVGAIAADLLRDVVGSDDVIGMGWARSLHGIDASLAKIPPCTVVQLTGALSGPDDSDVINLVRGVARAGGGTPHVYYAPLVAPDSASARMVRRQPDVVRAMAVAERVSVAVVGVGAWAPGLSKVYDSVEAKDRDEARALGTIGEISGALIDASGGAVSSPLSRRIIAITPEQLRRIDTVLTVSYTPGKAPTVAAAMRRGIINGLVTNSAFAEELMTLHDLET